MAFENSFNIKIVFLTIMIQLHLGTIEKITSNMNFFLIYEYVFNNYAMQFSCYNRKWIIVTQDPT